MSISTKLRAERQANKRKRGRKRQAKRGETVFNRPIRFSEFFADDLDRDRIAQGPLKLLSLDVTFEPMPDPEYQSLPADWRSRLDPIYLEPIDDLKDHIDLLEQATHANLPVPRLWNLLGNAYSQRKRDREAGEVYANTIDRFPDYFFGYICYAAWLIQQDRLDEVVGALGGNFDLERLLRGRTIVHHSEMMAYHSLLVQYFMAVDNLRQAAISMDFLEEADPEHPASITLRELMLLKLLAQLKPPCGEG